MVKESSPMVGGDGPNSYAQNSSYQKEGADAAKELMCEGIKKNLDFENPNFDKLTTFTVADLGCSTGPNTFFAVKYIIEAVNHKYHTQLQNPPPLEFQVLFNDQTDNDFNTLFKSLSSYQNYFAAGVPVAFFQNPPSILLIPFTPCTGYLKFLMFQTPAGLLYQFLGDSLRDMAKLGVISEEKVDNFNLPLYYSSPKELEEIIKGNGHFSIENLHVSDRQVKYDPETSVKFSVGENYSWCCMGTGHYLDAIYRFGSDVIDVVVSWTKSLCIEISQGHIPNHVDDIKSGPVEQGDKYLSSWSVLDIGTGNGLLLQELAKQGFACSSVHWLSKIPREILEAPALNKESIYCSRLVKEVTQAYSNQFKNDMNKFLNARADEIVGGGLMAILIVGHPNGDNLVLQNSRVPSINVTFDVLSVGVINEEKVESFNLPVYDATSELEEIINRNGHFSIKSLEIMKHQAIEADVKLLASHLS
ncbi:hypothetical protein JCGZ_02519 [Jatropha curcas]|uniref:Uncharacterized protein n=1 Tax=Jatropha curcas TaxID=180498 RepID=A0A067JFR3_JATCU|nr:hypothetical protein JCGZ_02519 [Jatropha curcas]